MSLNLISMMGNLTRNPEIKHIPSGKAVCRLSIANNRVYNKNNERMSDVSYFDVEVWGVSAENCAKYLNKGSGVIVEGRLQQERWEKDGKTHSNVKIIANAVHFLPKSQSNVAGPESAALKSLVEEVASAVSAEDVVWNEN